MAPMQALYQSWHHVQADLFPWLDEELGPLGERHRRLVAVPGFARVESLLPRFDGLPGRPAEDRAALARAFAAKPQLLSQVLGVVYRAISTDLLKRTGFTVASGAKTGAVTLIQRFGSALNLNIHFHMLFLEGVYSFGRARPKFHRAPRPAPHELEKLPHRTGQRVARLLKRQGPLVRDPDHDFLDFEPCEAFDHLVGASIHYRIAIGPDAGRKALTPRTVPAQPEPFASTLLARQPGFSPHAATCCEANQRDRLEKLCRYITRPAIANERLSLNDRGQVIYRFKQAFRDGTAHVVLDPINFIVRLAALVPRPRLNLTRFHGVFATFRSLATSAHHGLRPPAADPRPITHQVYVPALTFQAVISPIRHRRRRGGLQEYCRHTPQMWRHALDCRRRQRHHGPAMRHPQQPF